MVLPVFLPLIELTGLFARQSEIVKQTIIELG